MTFLDPIENASKCDLLAGKDGGLFSRWDHIRTPQCRKRIIPGRSYTSACDSWDYLKPTTVTDTDVSVFHPVSSVYETKFHRGFSRRMFPQQGYERSRIENEGFDRYNRQISAKIETFMSNPRNLITGTGQPVSRPYGKRAGDYLVSPFRESRRMESRKRVATSSCRFHEHEIPDPRAILRVSCESVVLGCAKGRRRNRARSVGIYDNFTHTQLPLDVPPPSPSRRNLSQITLC